MATDMLSWGVNWLNGVRNSTLGNTVTYSRGGVSVAIAATVGNTEWEIDTGETVRVESNMKDFIVTASHLVLSGEVVQPKRGDRITAGGVVWEVMAPGDMQPYRLDNTGQQMRIHTRRVKR